MLKPKRGVQVLDRSLDIELFSLFAHRALVPRQIVSLNGVRSRRDRVAAAHGNNPAGSTRNALPSRSGPFAQPAHTGA